MLILTGLDGASDRVRGLDAGADDYRAKPFEPTELKARVRAGLGYSLENPTPAKGI